MLLRLLTTDLGSGLVQHWRRAASCFKAKVLRDLKSWNLVFDCQRSMHACVHLIPTDVTLFVVVYRVTQVIVSLRRRTSMCSFRPMEKLDVWCLHVSMLGHQGALPTKHSPSVQKFRLRVVEEKTPIIYSFFLAKPVASPLKSCFLLHWAPRRPVRARREPVRTSVGDDVTSCSLYYFFLLFSSGWLWLWFKGHVM